MSDFQPEIIKAITDWLTQIRKCYEEEVDEVVLNSVEHVRLQAKIEAINELMIDINEPFVVVNVPEEIQQTLNVIEAKNIINDNPNKDEL